MQRCVIYARYSSDHQQEDSIEAQLKACEKYAEDNKWVIVNEYIDRAKTAKTARRPQFQQMIQDAELKKFDIVLVHKLDRFARNRGDKMIYKQLLKENGVSIVSALERLDDEPESIILESMLDGMAEYYSANLARETMKVLKNNAEKGLYNGGVVPLGLKVNPETQKYEIDETEAVIVKDIFRLFNLGLGYKKIAQELNDKGYKTKKGQPFGQTSIFSVLRNEKYIGTYVYNKSASADADNRRNGHKYKPEEKIIKIKDFIPALISKEEWAQAQKRIEKNKAQKHVNEYKAKETYLLTSIIKCKECGGAMTGNRRSAGKKNKTKYVSYRCNCRSSKGDRLCSNKEIRKELLEEYILWELEDRIFSEKNIPIFAQKLAEYQNNKYNNSKDKLKLHKRQLAETEKGITNILKAIESGCYSETVMKRLNELEKNKDIIENELKYLEASQTEITVSPEMVKNLINHFKTSMKNKDLPELRKFAQNFVKEVEISKDHVEVVFNYNKIVFLNGGERGIRTLGRR